MFCQAMNQLHTVKLNATRHLKTLPTAEAALDWINWSHPASCLCLKLLRWRYLLISMLLKGTVLYFLILEHPENSGTLLGFAKCKKREEHALLQYIGKTSGSGGPWSTYLLRDIIPCCTHFITCLPCSYALPECRKWDEGTLLQLKSTYCTAVAGKVLLTVIP